eukprot:201845-Prymnesium_polylepis.1
MPSCDRSPSRPPRAARTRLARRAAAARCLDACPVMLCRSFGWCRSIKSMDLELCVARVLAELGWASVV